MFPPGLVVRTLSSNITTSCMSRCLSERIQMDIYWFPTNENGITSVRLVAIFSLYPLDRKPQWRLIFDDTGGASGNRIFFYIPLYVAESACKGPKWLQSQARPAKLCRSGPVAEIRTSFHESCSRPEGSRGLVIPIFLCFLESRRNARHISDGRNLTEKMICCQLRSPT